MLASAQQSINPNRACKLRLLETRYRRLGY